MKMIVMIGITVLVLSVTFASLFTLVAMLSQNKAIIAVACILFSFGLLFAGAMCNRMLDAPKTITSLFDRRKMEKTQLKKWKIQNI
mgnify:CR=1 FL=1